MTIDLQGVCMQCVCVCAGAGVHVHMRIRVCLQKYANVKKYGLWPSGFEGTSNVKARVHPYTSSPHT